MKCPVCLILLIRLNLKSDKLVYKCLDHFYVRYSENKIDYYSIEFKINGIKHRLYFDKDINVAVTEIWRSKNDIESEMIFDIEFQPSEDILLNFIEVQQFAKRLLKLKAFL